MKREDILHPKFAEKFFRLDFEAEPMPVLTLYPPPPPIPLEAVRLEVSGLEEHPRTISWAALKDLPRVKTTPPLICQIFNWSETVAWEGIRLVDFLDYFKIDTHPEGYFAFYSRDKCFFEGLSRDEARDPRVLLVFGLNREALPEQHGGPLRLVVPFLQGYKSVKWIHAIRGFRNDPIGIKRLLGQSPTGIFNDKWRKKYQIVPPVGKAGDPPISSPSPPSLPLKGREISEEILSPVEGTLVTERRTSGEASSSTVKLKEVIAIIRAQKHVATRKALEAVGIFSYTTQTVLGRSKQRGLRIEAEVKEGVTTPAAATIRFLPKQYFSIVVTEKQAALAISAIVKANRTGVGAAGDGRIFVVDIDEAVRISTDDRGGSAVS